MNKNFAGTLALAGAACLLLAVPATASAQVGDTFSTATGFAAGSELSCGTTLAFKVLTEPTAGQPGTVQVGDGQAAALDKDYSGAVTLPESVSYNGTAYDVTSCAAHSFSYCSLSSVAVSSTVTRIGQEAFYACVNLRNVEYAADSSLAIIQDKAFQLPTANGGLSQIRIPASVSTIGANAFTGQSSATSLVFDGDSMESIGEYAFSSCTGLKTAEIPAITAESSGLGALTFYGDKSLETVIFKGDIASTGFNLGSRLFDDCTSLTTAVYRGKKCLPYYESLMRDGITYYGGYQYSKPNLYYTVTYYPSKEDALAKSNALGSVCVRSDTLLCNITSGLGASDAKGKVIYEGSVVEVPQGYTGWGYEGSPDLTAPIDDSLYAYPVDAEDLSFGSASLQEAYTFTGNPLEVEPAVTDASGRRLAKDVDYAVSYQRENAAGQWTDTQDLTSLGSVRVVVEGRGSYRGATSAETVIANAEVGASFEVDGITYCVTKEAALGAPGEVSVGDGTERACDAKRSGKIVIPQSVAPAGSKLSYAVTSVADFAFGAKTEEDACTSLTGVELPEGVTAIGNSAFAHCTSLEAVLVPASVKTLGARCYQGCSGVGAVEFEGELLQSIGSLCFSQCASITQLVLPSISQTFSYAFSNCVSLAQVEFKGAFAGADATQFSGCSRLAKVIYDAEVSEASFESNPDVYFITGTGVSAAQYKLSTSGTKKALAYVACLSGKTTAIVPDYVAVCGSKVKVTVVAASAFKGTAVKTVTVKAKSITSFKNALKSSKVATVKVPKAKLSAYKKLLAKAKSGKSVKVAA